jgi:hypothetical protein
VGEKAVVAPMLTDAMINSGASLVRQLDEQDLSPDNAFWLYRPEPGDWTLVLAEAKFETQGPRWAYSRIRDVLAAAPQDFAELALESISLASPRSPLVSLLRAVISTGPGSNISGMRFTSNVINGVLIEDAYIYRLRGDEATRRGGSRERPPRR